LGAISTIFGGRRGAVAALAVAATTLVACLASAQEATPPQDESPLHSLARGFGFATGVDPPPDFVTQSRPAEPQAEIPAFTPLDEPPGKPKSAQEIEAIDNDLDAIAKRHDALLATFPPAAKAKAAAAAAAEKKAKSKRKPPPAAGAPPL
jgi:hypothetical protein